jgi:hypothetical protein
MPAPRRQRVFPWRPVVIYVAIVVVAGIGLVIWDRSYEASRHSVAAPSPEAAATHLVENVVGSGTVSHVVLDKKTGTLTMDVKDVVTDKNKTPVQNRELLSGEGSQAAQAILGFISFKQVALHLVKDGKTVATVRAEPGKPPQTEFAPDLK